MRADIEKIIADIRPTLSEPTYACPICKDTGYIETVIDGYEYAKECECQIRAREQKRQEKYIAESGLQTVLDSMTFDTYEETEKANANLKATAKTYLNEYQDYWWYISGVSGCGKTHITTAICGELIKQGIPVHYMQWRDESTEIKSLVNDDTKYGEKMRRLKKVKVLYIDDFFKGAVTEADIKLAFEIINARYISKLPTLFSSELSVKEILDIDEAIAGRINQRADKYVLNVRKIGNRRL
ncbi:ATP-binding protein [Gallibacter intestinalis]|uniref:ATP-binding protein n=1 Tax=Gallibacter intestinalis TaxID=2779356 RepID=A0ABR9QY70_9FIRM|nr:ATP-binding protein [Gallibacter intestinalis]MBE5035840.1 ATP-binding protein [Gallibacter intestinalis]